MPRQGSPRGRASAGGDPGTDGEPHRPFRSSSSFLSWTGGGRSRLAGSGGGAARGPSPGGGAARAGGVASGAFPLWGRDTARLAREMIAGGLRATLTCVDPRRLDPSFAGRAFDGALLEALPADVDPCGERGEFHTFCSAGPPFPAPIPIARGEVVTREGSVFADLVHAGWLP